MMLFVELFNQILSDLMFFFLFVCFFISRLPSRLWLKSAAVLVFSLFFSDTAC